jgi:hypothetical protein
MAESYKKAKLITTTGATSGFIGFHTPTSQAITISGPFIYGATGAVPTPLTLTYAANSTIPVNCTNITPSTSPIIGFLA